MLLADVSRDAMLSGLEEVLISSADDICMHRAYANALIQSCDPANLARGRFIDTQLKLEEPNCPADQKRKLEGRKRKLLKDHGRTWLGGLAVYLLDRPGYRFEMWRGWLESVTAPALETDFIAALAVAPQARLLRRLEFASREPGGLRALEMLRESAFFEGLLELQIGEVGKSERPEVVLERLLG